MSEQTANERTTARAEATGGLKRSWWEWAGLAGVTILAAGLRLWNLKQNGLCNLYFSAGVRSMLTSWHNFFYASFDPGGFLTIDKPPVAYWIQTLCSKLVGFNSYGLLLPEALAGTAVVVMVYSMVRRVFGGMAGLLAALVLALTPISVAMDRHNNADSLMVFFLVLAAWAVLRATERGSLSWLLLGMSSAGVAFNTKMLLACVGLPAFYLLYFLGARVSWKARFGHLAAASAVLAAVSLSWPLAFDLTPANQRPYVGSTKDNSMLSLTIGWNGMARLTGKGRFFGFGRRPGQGPNREAGSLGRASARSRPGASTATRRDFEPPAGGPPGGGMFGIGSPGLLRFATRSLATQILWLWPLAVLGGIGVATRFRVRFPLGLEHQQILLWTVWAFTMAGVFSFARGITHSYYTLQMAPALAALTGISLAGLWTEVQRGGWRGWMLPLLLVGQGAWTAYLLADHAAWARVLKPIVWGGVGIGAAALIATQFAHKVRMMRGVGMIGLAVAVLAVLASPGAWSVTPCLVVASATQPQAGPGILKGRRGPMDFDRALEADSGLIQYLQKHRQGEKWLVATANTTEAAPLIVATGEPVMAIGGWQGAEPAITSSALEQKIKNHELRFVLLSSFGPNAGQDERFRWIRENATPVPRRRWQLASAGSVRRGEFAGRQGFPGAGGFGGRGGFGGMGASGLYDCQE